MAREVNRVRSFVPTYIRGFDDGLGRGIPKGQVVLIRGATGTMKSSIAYSILYHNAEKGIRGLYVTLEQDGAAFLAQMAALGLKPTSVSNVLPVLDLGRGREVHEKLARNLKDWARAPAERPMTALLKAKISQLREEFRFELLAIDSWTALIALLELEDLRRETFDLFEWLRSLGCTAFVIAEEAEGQEGLEEEFLADAIFRLRLEAVTDVSFQRRIQCSKMRSANHSSDFFTLVFEKGYFEVAKAIS